MLSYLLRAGGAMALFTAALGFAYPLGMIGLAQTLMPEKADASLIERDGTIIGSALVGQAFVLDRYVHPRPSAAGAGYEADNSSGTNYGPTSAALIEDVRKRADAFAAANGTDIVPVHMVTASGSGLDPHITPEAAIAQAGRIAAARGVSTGQIEQVIKEVAEGRTFGLLGEPRVNVLLLNLALDDAFGTAATDAASEGNQQ